MSEELEIQRVILEAAKYLPGVELWRNRSTEAGRLHRSRNDAKRVGSPDLEGWVDGFHLGVEVKVPGKELEDQQLVWRERMIGAGCCHVTAHSVEEFMAGIDRFRQENVGPEFGS